MMRVVIWIFLAGIALARPAAGETWDLASLKAEALAASPSLGAARLNWEAALERASAAGALPDPQLRMGFFLEEVQTRVGAQRAKLGLSQRLPGFGKRSLASAVAMERAAAEGERYRAARLDLLLAIERSYLGQAHLARALELRAASLELLAGLESVTGARVRTGKASRRDLLRLQSEIERQEDALAALAEERHAELARLSSLLGRRLAELPDLSTDFMPAPMPADLDFSTSPTLAILKREEAGLDRAGALARRAGWPDFTLWLDYIFTDPRDDFLAPDNGKDPLVLGFGLSLPIWRGKYRAGERDAAARLEGTRERLAQQEMSLAARLEGLLAAERQAARELDRHRESLLPRAREILVLSESDYRTGRASFDELIDAQREQLELELAMEALRRDLALRRTEILHLLGREDGRRS